MLNRKKASVIYIALVLLYGGCKQSAPTDVVVADEKGDLTFSGYNWKYKNALTPVGPGPNRFFGNFRKCLGGCKRILAFAHF